MASKHPQDGLNGHPFQPGDNTKGSQDGVESDGDKEMALAIQASLVTEQEEAEARQPGLGP